MTFADTNFRFSCPPIILLSAMEIENRDSMIPLMDVDMFIFVVMINGMTSKIAYMMKLFSKTDMLAFAKIGLLNNWKSMIGDGTERSRFTNSTMNKRLTIARMIDTLVEFVCVNDINKVIDMAK